MTKKWSSTASMDGQTKRQASRAARREADETANMYLTQYEVDQGLKPTAANTLHAMRLRQNNKVRQLLEDNKVDSLIGLTLPSETGGFSYSALIPLSREVINNWDLVCRMKSASPRAIFYKVPGA